MSFIRYLNDGTTQQLPLFHAGAWRSSAAHRGFDVESMDVFGLRLEDGGLTPGPCACHMWYLDTDTGNVSKLASPIPGRECQRVNQWLERLGLGFSYKPNGYCSCGGRYPELGMSWFNCVDDALLSRLDGDAEMRARRRNRVAHAENGNTKSAASSSSTPAKKQTQKPAKGKLVQTAKAKAQVQTKSNGESLYSTMKSKGGDQRMAEHYTRMLAPSTLALMAQVIDPDGPSDQATDPALRVVSDPVGIPAELPDKRMTLPVMSREKVTVPPGAFFLVQGGFSVRSSGSNSANNLAISRGYNQVVFLTDGTGQGYTNPPAVLVANWSTAITEVEPYLYNLEDSPVGVADDPTLNKLAAGCTNDGNYPVPGEFDPAAYNATFEHVIGGASKLKPTCFPDSEPVSVATAGGYTRVEVLFTNQLDAIQLHGLVTRRGRVRAGTQRDESLTVVDGGDHVQIVAQGDNFFYPPAFALFEQGAGFPSAAGMPGFGAFTDLEKPYTGEKLLPTSLAWRCLRHAILPDGVFDIFDDELYPTPEWPATTINLTGAMEKEVGLKVRSPTWDSSFTEYSSYNDLAFINQQGEPHLTPATSISTDDGCSRLIYGINSSANPIVLTISSVDYVCATYSSLLDLPVSAPPDPFQHTASVLALHHPVFTTPNSFLNWLKKAGNTVLGGLKDLGNVAAKSVLQAIPGALTKMI